METCSSKRDINAVNIKNNFIFGTLLQTSAMSRYHEIFCTYNSILEL